MTAGQLETCRRIFEILDREEKEFIVMEDLKNCRDGKVCELVKAVFARKEKNSFFDFLYGLWDIGVLEKLESVGHK